MTKTEAMKIVCVLFGSFPNARFNEQNFESYAEGISELDAATCGAAVLRLIRTSKFLPSISEIREAATAQVMGPRKTGAEAYGELTAAVQRHGQYPEVRWIDGEMRVQTPWPPLAPDVAHAMRLTWGTWAECCGETGIDAPSRARFIAAYDGLAERERLDIVAGKPLPAPKSGPQATLPKPRPVPPAQLTPPVPRAVPVPIPVPVLRSVEPRPVSPYAGRKMTAEEIDAALAAAEAEPKKAGAK